MGRARTACVHYSVWGLAAWPACVPRGTYLGGRMSVRMDNASGIATTVGRQVGGTGGQQQRRLYTLNCAGATFFI